METLVQQQYDRLAAVYDQRWQGYITNTLAFLVDWARIAPAETVLDVACGTGELERLLIEQQAKQIVTGVDFFEPDAGDRPPQICRSALGNVPAGVGLSVALVAARIRCGGLRQCLSLF